MNDLLIVAGILVLLGLPSLLVLCACITGTQAEYEIQSRLAQRLAASLYSLEEQTYFYN